jgi:hypothetical protein
MLDYFQIIGSCLVIIGSCGLITSYIIPLINKYYEKDNEPIEIVIIDGEIDIIIINDSLAAFG